jgi:AcrR family transcriptional regulator
MLRSEAPVESERFLKSDPRAEKTRRAIFSAVESLTSAESTPLTVSDIVRSAAISRSSFYAHFSGLDDLAREYLHVQLADARASVALLVHTDFDGRLDAAQHSYRRLLTHMVKHYPVYASVLDLSLSRGAYDEVVQGYASLWLDSIDSLGGLPIGPRPELTATYVAGGALTLIGSTLKGRVSVSDDDLVDELARLLPATLLETQFC